MSSKRPAYSMIQIYLYIPSPTPIPDPPTRDRPKYTRINTYLHKAKEYQANQSQNTKTHTLTN